MMWCGSVDEIPSGWALCDGSIVDGFTTPNLIDRFIIGSRSVGVTGGSNSLTLSLGNIPEHSHTFYGTEHGHTLWNATVSGTLSGTTLSISTSGNTHSHTFYGTAKIIYLIGDGKRIVGHIGVPADTSTNNTITLSTYSQSLKTGIAVTAAGTLNGNTHSHTVNVASHTHTFYGTEHGHTLWNTTASGTLGSSGSGEAFDNRPSYYSLCFIVKL